MFYPRMKRPCLPLPTIQAATTKILPTKCLNIAKPRIFCPPKITRYTVVCLCVSVCVCVCVRVCKTATAAQGSVKCK